MVLQYDLLSPFYSSDDYKIENITIIDRLNVKYLDAKPRYESEKYQAYIPTITGSTYGIIFCNTYQIEINSDFDWNNISEYEKLTSPGYHFIQSEEYKKFRQQLRKKKIQRIWKK